MHWTQGLASRPAAPAARAGAAPANRFVQTAGYLLGINSCWHNRRIPTAAGRPGSRALALKREILISGTARETRVAILEDDRLVELLVDRPDARRMVGDIYLGTVEAVLPGIQAAFVNIGAEKSAFLHASDLIEAEDEDEPS